MNSGKYCSEIEAVAFAGVSARTLLRFSEAGYLSVHTNSDGSKLFERAQLEQIFGVAAGIASPETDTTSSINQCDTNSYCETSSDSETASETKTYQPPCSDAWRIPSDTVSSRTPDQSEVRNENSSDEISRLKNLLSLQERILDAKDDEIADLKNQRAWLRERIEKLEEKSDRDQILLLSETQTIRSLIAYQEARKSPIRQFLEWSGLVSPAQVNALPQVAEYKQNHSGSGSSSKTIEVPRAANGD